jgi:tetratricopeptide (TPR) repeat protein
MDQIPLDDSSITYFLDEMEQDEKAQYADDFLLRGELALLQGNISKGMELFNLASKCDLNNALLFYRQGISLFEYGSEEGREKALSSAIKKFRTAAHLDPYFFDNWHAWGNTLFQLGRALKEKRYFLEAEEKYRKALDCSQNQKADLLADLYWDHGLVWMEIAEHSGEAMDAQLALDAFRKASSLQERLPADFWNDYGTAALLLACKVTDIRLYVKAINCFKHAVSNDSSYFDGWISLASALQSLYALTHDEDHFSQANECFATAAQIEPNDIKLWLDWAKFLCTSGRRTCDTKRLRNCIEKCQRAYACDQNEPLAIAIWAEALALLGELSERLDLIYEAQNKIAEADELAGDDPEICYSSGMCLNSFGRYFQDLDYYYQAIEKFQYGLSLDRTFHPLWHAIAATHTIVGQIVTGTEAFERSCRFFRKAIDLHPSSYYIADYAFALMKWGDVALDQKILEEAGTQFERALQMQRNAVYLHPDWLFNYAVTLDMLGDFHEEESYYGKALEILNHVLMIDPDFPAIHYRLALAYAHRGELMCDTDNFYRSLHHYRLASKHEEENDQIILDWGITLINISQHVQDAGEAEQFTREAENKLTLAAKLGHPTAYYHLGTLYSLTGQYERSIAFLQKARQFKALPSIDELMQDDWLEDLRCTSEFRDFLTELEKRHIREP